MIISIVSLLLLIVAAYFLIKTKPNLFLLDFMKEVFGEAKEKHHNGYADKPQNENVGSRNTSLHD